MQWHNDVVDKITEPIIKFEIEIRPAGTIQKEAGKRLFKRLVAGVQSSNQTINEQKNVNMKT